MTKPTAKNQWADIYFERTKRNHFWVGGLSGQAQIKNLKVGVAGLGGMGSNIAEIFARLGVGHLRITDPDVIDRPNINRQVIAWEDTIGLKKAAVSAADIRRIDPTIRLEVSEEGIQESNVKEFVKGLDVVINEIDVYHIDKQLLLVEAALNAGIPVYTTLVVGVGIHLYKFDPKSSYKAHDFFSPLLSNLTIEKLIEHLGQPLPGYLNEKGIQNFITHVKDYDGVPIFGASTYAGQSLLAVRVLYDLGLLKVETSLPKTPHLPEFLVLDPLMLEFKVARLNNSKKVS